MTGTEALSYIHSVSWKGSVPGLSRITELMHRLGDPQDRLRFVHVAGTNGKGSFCAMLSSVLTAAGYRTGTFTSPYVRHFNERMAVDGEPISDPLLAELTETVRPFADAMEDKPTEFELITAIGILYFVRMQCDLVVFECGMGGRLDSTNVIRTSVLSVITGIALDHTALLGSTFAEIAAEKAGILKAGIPVLFGGENPEAAAVIRRHAADIGCPYHETDHAMLTHVRCSVDGSRFDFGCRKDIAIGLAGVYQPYNAAIVLDACDLLLAAGYTLPEDAIRLGLQRAKWQARFEVLSRSPLILYDGAHNPQGIAACLAGIRTLFPGQKLRLLAGVMADKDYLSMTQALSPVALEVFTVTPNNPRSLDATALAAAFLDAGVAARPFSAVLDAVAAAYAACKADGIPLMILGSLYLYAEIRDAGEAIGVF